ncbi:MAG: AAA family ATPase, partial [Rickettsiales bacterium]|nr:AAA family ATPase [Rickettsiales bacterium]
MYMTALAIKSVPTVKEAIKTIMPSEAYDAWIAPLEIAGNTLVTTSRFNADFIRSNFAPILAAAGAEVSMARPRLRVISNSAALSGRRCSASDDSFDSFVCSESNAFALAAIKKCASGSASFSPLVMHGASGCGKTMLLDLLQKNAAVRKVCTSGSAFVSDFVRSMKDGSLFAWKDSLRRCDLFMMDDIQTIAGKRASAEEFFSLISDMVHAKKTVVLASSISPSQISGFDRQLVSLLSSGLSVDLSLPDSATRGKILVSAGLSPDLASRVPSNGHVIAGVVKKIAAWRELGGGDLSEQVLEKLLGDILEKQKTPLAAVKGMCATLGVSFDDVSGPTRVKKIVFARQKIMFALKSSTNLTLGAIGRLVGGRDHATVLYALGQIER